MKALSGQTQKVQRKSIVDVILNNKSVKGHDTLFELIKVTIAQSKNPCKLEFQRVTHPIYEVIMSDILW